MSQNIEEKLNRLEKNHIDLVKEIQKLINIEVFIENNSVSEKDRIWVCEKCKFKLGVFDTKKQELRVRYKDFYIWNKLGEGGKVKTICRSCSFLNTLSLNDIKN